ncbi:hypothetical protein [Methylovirgula sp. 4M-Z18]|nr:hypothetical protein [Methylovirgula sp. 4M-Z18]
MSLSGLKAFEAAILDRARRRSNFYFVNPRLRKSEALDKQQGGMLFQAQG